MHSYTVLPIMWLGFNSSGDGYKAACRKKTTPEMSPLCSFKTYCPLDLQFCECLNHLIRHLIMASYIVSCMWVSYIYTMIKRVNRSESQLNYLCDIMAILLWLNNMILNDNRNPNAHSPYQIKLLQRSVKMKSLVVDIDLRVHWNCWIIQPQYHLKKEKENWYHIFLPCWRQMIFTSERYNSLAFVSEDKLVLYHMLYARL